METETRTTISKTIGNITFTNKRHYRLLTAIGSGTFGTVFTGISPNNQIVAIKKVYQDPRFVNRELDILKSIHSNFCLSLIDSYTEIDPSTKEDFLYIVTEKMPISLRQTLKESRMFQEPFNPFLQKLYSYELLCGLHDLHSMGIAHRDIKPDNILLDPLHGQIKICDFGSAKVIENDRNSVSEIGSLNYRAPELLLGNRTYSTEIDIWSTACVIGEMLLDDYQMFQGVDNHDQLVEIMKIIGPPTEEDENSFSHTLPWPDVEKIANISIVLPQKTDPKLIDLLEKCFVYNPSKRATALELLKHPFFDELFTTDKLPNGAPMPQLPRFK